MIQLSPHTEAAQFVSQEQHGARSPQQSKAEKSALGVFAKILAGLSARKPASQTLADQGSSKTGTGEQSTGVKVSKTEKPGAAGSTLHGAGKVRTGKIAATTAETKKNGAVEPEMPQSEFSEQEKNIFFTVHRLAAQNEEQRGKVSKVATPTAETSKTNAIPATVTLNESVAEQGKQTITAASAAASELVENPRDVGNKRAKNRTNPIETLAQGDSAGRKVTGTELSQRLEVRRAVSGEKEGRNRLEEARNRRRSATFDLRDYRTGIGQGEFSHRDGAMQVRAGAETRISGDGTVKEVTLELRLPNQGQESSSATTSWETKAGQSFEDMLARELHQNFNNDIVRHASVALRDEGEGTIRLALKPESLGNVKIRLEMTDNKITGYIVVESEEALRAFEREISSLEKAFRDSGFDDANLEMSLAGDNQGTDQKWQGTEASRFLPGQFAASRYDTAIEQLEIPLTLDVYQQGSRAVNVLV